MLTQTQISDGRTVTLDIEPMTAEQQLMLCTAVADLLIRSGQIRAGSVFGGPHLLQFLSEAADMAEQQATPIDPADVAVFEVKDGGSTRAGQGQFLAVPDDLLILRTLDTNFDEGCSTIRTVNDAIASDPDLAEATSVLLNRAYWLGQGRCAPFHVTPRD
jgi:hypothetical protein